MLKIVCSIIFIVGFASTEFAGRCNICSSLGAQECAEPFEGGRRYDRSCEEVAPHIPNINLNSTGCLKIKSKTSDGVEEISRSCYFGKINDTEGACSKAEKEMQGSKKLIKCDFCTEDACNRSTTTGAFAAIIMLFAVTVRMMS